MRGTVTEFDEARCLGAITGEDQRTYPFHGVCIADASRNINNGADVTFAVLAKLGRYEATNIQRYEPA